MTLLKNLFLLSSTLLGILAIGCSSKNSEFFILNPAKFSNIEQHKSCRNKILVQNVIIPDYIDKPEIVTRISPNQLFQAEFHRWAEPLGGNITAVIAQNLSSQLAKDVILTTPGIISSNINYYLKINVNQFDVDGAGVSTLKVTWNVYNANMKLIKTRNASYRFLAQNPKNYPDVTFTMNKNISAFSSDLAQQLKNLPCGGQQ